jgi:hypothetical protein
MFNGLFGKKGDGEVETVESQLLKDYGDKRSYTFPDGKTVTWDLFIGEDLGSGIYTKQIVMEVLNEKIWSDTTLKDLEELSPPAKQLFLVLVKDQKNIKIREVRGIKEGFNEYTHAKLGITVKTSWYSYVGWTVVSATGIDIESANQVMRLYKVYAKVFNLESRADRYKRVRAIRDKKLQTRKLNAYLKTLPE